MFKDIKVKEVSNLPLIFNFGFQLVKPYHFEIKVASTGKTQIILHFEGKPPKEGEIYKENDKITKPDGSTPTTTIGKANLGIYFDFENEAKKIEFFQNLTILADKTGVRDELNKLPQLNTLEEIVEAINKVFAKANFIYLKLNAEEYQERKFNYSLGSTKNGDVWNLIAIEEKAVTKTEVSELLGKDVITKIFYKNSEGKAKSYKFNEEYDLKTINVTPDDENASLGEYGEEDVPTF